MRVSRVAVGLKKMCGVDAGPACADVVRVRVQIVRVGAGTVTEYKLMCGFSQTRGPAGRVRARGGPRGGCGHELEVRADL